MTYVRCGIFALCGLAFVIFSAQPAHAGCEELHVAVDSINYGVIDSELGGGTSVNCIDSKGNAPLHTAVYTLDSRLVSYLLSRGALVNIEDSTGATALTVALDGYEFLDDADADLLDPIVSILKNAGGIDAF